MIKNSHLNAKGQVIVTSIILIIVAAMVGVLMLAPVSTIIDASISAGNFTAETTALLYLIPTIILAALIASFFMLGSQRQQYQGG